VALRVASTRLASQCLHVDRIAKLSIAFWKVIVTTTLGAMRDVRMPALDVRAGVSIWIRL